MKTENRIASFALFVGLLLVVPTGLAYALDQDRPTTQPAIKPATRPAVGQKAMDFTLRSVEGEPVTLSKIAAEGPVVLVVLRGWPGYQCPICTRQVADLMSVADEIKAASAKVLLVYPGPAENLTEHAKEFIPEALPEGMTFVVDPDFEFVNAYDLRWDAPRETAYPSTFVIDRQQIIRFTKISDGHGDRAESADVLAALNEL